MGTKAAGWMRAIGRATILIALVLPSTVMAQQAPLRGAALQDAVAAVGGRVIVTMKRPAGAPAMMAPGAPPISVMGLQVAANRLTKERGMTGTRPLPLVGAVAGQVSPAELAALENDPEVELVEPDVWMPLQEEREWPSVGAALAQSVPWGITRVQAPEAWAIVGKGAGIKVGIMDSGGDASHPDLNFAGGYNAMTQSTATSAWQDDVSSCNGHGTHVAGTVAALDNDIGVVGVAPEVTLYALKVFETINGSCGAWSSSQIQALNWAISQGIRVVNASIGGSATGSYMLAVSNAAANGTYLVASAGNTGGVMLYPAGYADAIGVAALTSSNTKASFSSVGPEMDFAAPGSGIQSTMPGGGYGSKSGTSMASPHVAGVAALLLAQDPGLSFSQLYDKLKAGAVDVDAGGFDNNTGWGMVQAASSLGGGGTPPPVPLAMTVSPTSRAKSAVAGSAVGGDSATVTLSGDNSTTTAWSATKRKAWTTLTAASGTGSGKVKWNRSTSGLAAGTYVDTITVAAPGVASRLVIDTLTITAAPVPLAMSVSPTSRAKSAVAGSAVGGDSATVTLSGDGSTTTAWSATKKKAWTTLTAASGTGSGKVKWNRSTSGLAAGTYVDTITVAAPGVASRLVIDTLTITAAPVPLAMSVSPTSRSTTAQVGTAAAGDSATVTLTGDNSTTTAWSATKKKAWTTLTAASGTGSGKVKWTRSTSGLSAGTYVDTITVTAPGVASRLVIDTLTITAAPVPLAMNVSPTSRSTTAQVGTAAAGDSATVTLTGDNSNSTAWSASKKKAWTTLTAGSGTGSGKVKWTRSTGGLSAGTYVDTITVTAPGVASRLVIDTLTITVAPVPLAMSVSPTSRSTTAQVGTAAAGDSATVTITGDGSTAKVWSATKKKAWTTLTAGSGTGSGKVKWTRSTSGLAAGTYVDTITVSASGLASRLVIDTLTITTAPVPVTMALAPGSRTTTVVFGAATGGDSASLTLSGDGGSTTAWTVSKKKAWTTLMTLSGTGNATIKWNRNTAGLSIGVHVDTITVTAPGVGYRSVIDTLLITAAPVPLAMTVSPTSRSTTAQVGTAAAGDSATVTLSGDNSSSTGWSATTKKAWTTLTAASGTGSGKVKWNRSTIGLAAGTYVDTITVSVSGLPSKTIVDTLTITATPAPVTIALAPGSRTAIAQVGTAVGGDSASLTLAGDGADTKAWIVSKKKAWTTLTTVSGTGSASIKWSRSTAGLAVGVYVDTITVSASGVGYRSVIDTLMITAAPVPLALAVTPSSRHVTVQVGAVVGGDSATVALSGANSTTTAWTATKKRAWTTLTTAGGIGSGVVTWHRSTSGLSAGTYVDTITVTAAGVGPRTVIDTLVVTSEPVVTPPPTPPAPIVATVAPASRLIVVPQQNGWAPDSAALQLSGAGATSANWTVVARKAHTSILNASGTGPATIQWRRRLNGLAPGTYVDTLTVTVTTLSAHVIIDSLIILPQTTANLSKRGGRTKVMESGRGRAAATGADTTSVIVSTIGDTGGGNQPAQWVATTTAPWIRITNGLTPTTDPIQWERQLDLLPLGRHIDSVVVTLSSNPSLRGAYVDTVDVVQVVEPTPTVAVEDLVRGGKLNVDQRDLFDAIGNRNGRFDLGDFLAWVDRNQIALTGAMMQSVVEVQARETAARARRAQAIERPDSLP